MSYSAATRIAPGIYALHAAQSMHAARGMIHAGHAADALTQWGGDTSSALGLSAMALWYAAGARRVWSAAGAGHGVRRHQVAYFSAALAVIAVALLSPIHALSGALFSAHMTQHVLLAVVAPPLLAAGAPDVAMLWAFPATLRRRIGRVMRQRGIARTWRAITQPVVAAAVHAVALWAWHAPRLYIAALRNPVVHFLEHACFVGTALLLWWGILKPHSTRRTAYATGILVLFLTALQSGALGALLTFSSRPWFPMQNSESALLHLTPLQDQQVAGLIMWVPGGLLYTAAMAILFAAWMRQLDHVSPSTGVSLRAT